tara:strand:+ start:602 stop:886 length:285 start_codon:yes stop_codon:yes gene_type:complete
MHKQDNTNRDTGLESIMESMYTAAASEPDTGRIPPGVDSFKGPDDQDNTSYQVAPELDAAAGGDFIAHLNTIEFDDQGAAALVEWLARYNLGAS